jgi:hypothetical protein
MLEKPFTGDDRKPANFKFLSAFEAPIPGICKPARSLTEPPSKISPQPIRHRLRSGSNDTDARYLHALQGE